MGLEQHRGAPARGWPTQNRSSERCRRGNRRAATRVRRAGSLWSCWWCRRWVLALDSMLLTTTW